MKSPSPESLVLYSLAALPAFGGVARYLWADLLENGTCSALAPWLFLCGAATWVWAFREHRRGPAPRPPSR